MNIIQKLPDYLLVRAANSYNGIVQQEIDKELDERFNSIKEELEQYEEFNQLD